MVVVVVVIIAPHSFIPYQPKVSKPSTLNPKPSSGGKTGLKAAQQTSSAI